MEFEDKKTVLAELVSSISGLYEFMSTHTDFCMSETIHQFKEELKREGGLNEEVSFKLGVILEIACDLQSDNDSIATINPTLVIDDAALLRDFITETTPTNDKWHFKRAEKQHYKTITEKIAYKECDYSKVLEKYSDCHHPYIYSEMALAFLNSKIYDVGLSLLQKALVYVFSSPNVYWNNLLAIYGCTNALYELQHQLGPNQMFDVSEHLFKDSFALLKCLYLYLSRSIYMSSDQKYQNSDGISRKMIERMNYLSSRADLLLSYRNWFGCIFFPMGINPDIQFISDKYMAYSESNKVGLDIIFKDCFNDSLKMYRHGSLIPNNTESYCDIADATYSELVERGRVRSYLYANDLYKHYKHGEFALSKSDLANCINYIMHLRTTHQEKTKS